MDAKTLLQWIVDIFPEKQLKINMSFNGNVEKLNKIWEDTSTSTLFVGLISQNDADTPTINILKNTIGETIVAKTGVGVFTITPPENTLIVGKTVPVSEPPLYDADNNKIVLTLVEGSHYLLETFDSNDTPTDGILDNQYISFEVYK